MNINILDYNTVTLHEEDLSIEIIDQTLLPLEVKLIRIKTAEEMWNAIYLLQVRGAPAIGVFAAYAIYVLTAISADSASNQEIFLNEFEKNKNYLNSSRPTAVNLSWALQRMRNKLYECVNDNNLLSDKDLIAKCVADLREEAVKIQNEYIDICKKIMDYNS